MRPGGDVCRVGLAWVWLVLLFLFVLVLVLVFLGPLWHTEERAFAPGLSARTV